MTEEQAKEYLTNTYMCCCPYGTSPKKCGNEKCEFGQAIRALIEERPQGEWIEDDNHNIFCPFCGGIRRDCRIDHINFCNRCGADMRGDT